MRTGSAVAHLKISSLRAELQGVSTTQRPNSRRVVGGLTDVWPHRMESADGPAVPQVLVPGCIDFITCGPWAKAEEEFPGRVMFRHNPELTLVRLRSAEMAQLGSVFAQKANAAEGPTSILIPTGGFSVCDVRGGPFWDPEADGAFIKSLQAEIRPGIRVEVSDAHINDARFADAAASELLQLINGSTATSVSNDARVSAHLPRPLRWGVVSTARIVEELVPAFQVAEDAELGGC